MSENWFSRIRKPCRPLKTFDEFRWSIQEAVAIAIAALPSRLHSVNSAFGGNARWIVPAACTVIDSTAGASIIRLLDRFAGTLIAGVWCAICFLCTVGASVNPNEAHPWYLLALLWFMVSLIGPFAGWVRIKLPSRPPVMSITIVNTAPVLLGAGLNVGKPLEQCMWRTVCVLAGVLVSGIVTRYVFPRRARVDLIVGLAKIVEQLARTLEPLVELESGLVVSESFFEHTGAGKIFTESTRESNDEEIKPHKVVITTDVWSKFKSQIWKDLESCGKLIAAQVALKNAARNEISCRTNFTENEHYEAVLQIRTLFYHVTALFTLIESHTQHPSKLAEEELMAEVEHWSKFGCVNIVSSENSSDGSKTPTSNHAVAEPQSDSEMYEADLCPTVTWAKAYGPIIGYTIRHVCSALSSASKGLRSNEIRPDVSVHMSKAGAAIALFHQQREERRQATAMGVDLLMMGEKNLSREFIQSFDKILGISVSQYRGLSVEGRDTFWDTYWTVRERISTTDLYITTLFVQASKAISGLEDLIRARIACIETGTQVKDSVDVNKLQLAKQIAITQAGGHGARYQAGNTN